MAGVLKQLNLSVRKRKKRISCFYRSSILSSPHLFASDDCKEDIDYQTYEIDDSSPIKKVKRSHSDNSHWFIAKNSKKNERRSSSSFNPANHDDDSLPNQLKKCTQAEKLQRESWLHSTTSKLKNKVKTSYQARTSITITLTGFKTRYSCTLADGIIKHVDPSEKSFQPDEVVKILFPAALAQTMGLACGTIISLTSPWKVHRIDGTQLIINPFWINVTDRSRERFVEPVEKTILRPTCACRDSLGEISPGDCEQGLSQKSTELSQL